MNENQEACVRRTDKETIHLSCGNEKQIVKNVNTRLEIFLKVILAIIFGTASVTPGMSMGYTVVLLPELQKVNGTLHTDEWMGSWIASVPAIASPVGAIIGGILIDSIGRKLTLQIQNGIAAAGWMFIAICGNHGLLLFGRLVTGVAYGLGLAGSQIYIAEVTDPNMRDTFSVIPVLSISVGILLVYLLGLAVSWRWLAGISLIPPAASAVLYFILPESPIWLVRHGHIEKARKAYLCYRGQDVIQADQEIQQLTTRAKIEKTEKKQTLRSICSSFCLPQVLKPLTIVSIFICLDILSGWILVILYAVDLVAPIVGENINEYFIAVLTAAVRLVFTIAAVYISASFRRRTIGIYSTFFTGLFALVLGACLYLKYEKSYLLTACLLFYVAASTAGFSTLGNTMIGEMFPARVRGAAGGMTTIIRSLLMFGFTKLFPFLRKVLGTHGLFLSFSLSSFLATVWVYLMLPETKGKTLNDIEDYFAERNILWASRTDKSRGLSEVKNMEL